IDLLRLTKISVRVDIFFFSSKRRHPGWPRDWSSGVCSSDLRLELGELAAAALRDPEPVLATLAELEPMAPVGPVDLDEVQLVLRSEERRVGKEGRFGWSPDQANKNIRDMTMICLV